MMLAPFARLPCDRVTACVAVGDGTIAFTSAKGTLVFADSDGVIVDELEMPEPGLSTTDLQAGADGTLVGFSGVYGNPNGVLLARRGDSIVRRWQTDIKQPHVDPIPGVGALVSGNDEIYLVLWDMTVEALVGPRLRGRDLSVLNGPHWWNHDVLVMTAIEPLSMEEPATDHEVHCMGGDGVVRFSSAGRNAIPVDDELALVWAENALHVIDRNGARLDTLERQTVIKHFARALTRVGDDVVLKIDMFDRSPGLLRITPRTLSKPLWETPFPAANARFSQNWPVRVGRHIAIYLCGPPDQRGVFVVDAESGAHVTTLSCDQETVGGLVAVADNVVSMNNVWGKQQLTYVWVGLDTSSPRQLKIQHEGASHHALCVPKPGVLACAFDDVVCLYRVS